MLIILQLNEDADKTRRPTGCGANKSADNLKYVEKLNVSADPQYPSHTSWTSMDLVCGTVFLMN